jgi:hypothetical protein
MELVLIGFAALAPFIIIVNIWARDRWVRLTLGGALLLLSYLALQFSWDIWHADMTGYVGTAPGPGVLAFLFGPVGLVLGIVAIVLLATSWRAVLRRFVALAAAPCLVAMVYHSHESIKTARLEERQANEWMREQDANKRNRSGGLWAQFNHITDFEDCSENPSGYPQFERNPDFQAGCLREVKSTRVTEGAAWAARRHPAADDDCAPSPSEVTIPEGIEACKENAHQVRMQLGTNWADNNAVFAAADCERGFAEMSNRKDYVAGCQRFVERFRSSRVAPDVGATWARTQHLVSEDDCHGRFRDATPEFEQGCADYLRTLRASGQDWARMHHISRPADCKSAPQAFQQQPVFVLGCEDAARGNP